MNKTFFSETDKNTVVQAIKDAENNTSGEIRVHLEDNCKKDPLERAVEIFQTLNMHKTELRNGVLFYLALKDKKFALIGDAGINAKVPTDFWDKIKADCLEKFKKEAYIEGLSSGIKAAGESLKIHFPHQNNDVNELSDDISFGDN